MKRRCKKKAAIRVSVPRELKDWLDSATLVSHRSIGFEIVQCIRDARRYRWLRSRDVDTIEKGGVFAGTTPQNLILTEEDLDRRVDEALNEAR